MWMNSILKKMNLPLLEKNISIKNITFHLEECNKGSLYICLKEDPTEEIEKAIEKGVSVILSRYCRSNHPNHIFVENPRKILAEIARIFYHDLSKKLFIVGVTGTNAKTTTSTIGYHFFNFLHRKSMLIGSNGIFCMGYEKKTNNTTPDILTIYEALSLAKKKKIHYIFMEISSISVDQWRIYGITFQALIFTNFTQDHLDYHKTLEHYLYCKLVPFIKLKKSAYAIINKDDQAYPKFTQYCDAKIITYGMKTEADVVGTLNTSKITGVSFYSKNYLFKTKLIGEFNVYNCLAILALCKALHIPYDSFSRFIAGYGPVPGRMNVIEYKHNHIIIDYAHTYTATKQAISQILHLCKKKLYIVIGCGGNREREKRFMIGKLLNETNADIILTTDNPRFEEPEEIISDIKSEITKPVLCLPNRKQAIINALEKLEPDDFLLVLGKGCENYIDIKGKKYPYSDQEVIYDWIANQ